MDFHLNDTQRHWRDVARKLAVEQIGPMAADVDAGGTFPWDNFRAMVQAGFCGLHIPLEYGGRGEGLLTLCLVIEELARACASTAAVLMATTLGTYPIVFAGTEDQKRRYLPGIAGGHLQGCFALTERQAGSDAGAVATNATPVEGGYELSGAKCFIGNGLAADVCLVVASTDRSKGVRGLTAFIVQKDTPGVRVGKLERKMGIRGTSTAELIFERCFVPADNLLGGLNRGFRVAMQNLDAARPTTGAQAIGIGKAAFEEALRYSQQRVQFGGPIASQQAIQFMLADMATELDAARLMVHRVAAMHDDGAGRITKEAAMAKLFASEVSHRVVDKALQVHGGYGYMRDFPLERFYRDQRITEIYEGTSEIQRLVIARELLRPPGQT